ncbi:MAG: hypothetical protein OXK82_12850 [Deltaproteobacteria bacterium]|nr:hypothetical protein [Deltaproteobacteria bacterium]
MAEPVVGEFPEEASPEVSDRVGALVIQRVETVNIYVTIVNGADQPLLSVQGN